MSNSQLQAERIETALSILSSEQDRHVALFHVIMQRVYPADEEDPGEDTDFITWRLGQILEELLTSTRTLDCVRTILTGGAK